MQPLYYYKKDRGQENMNGILENYCGVIQLDGYQVYSKFYSADCNGKKEISACGYNRSCTGNFYVVRFNCFSKNEPPGCIEVSDLCTGAAVCLRNDNRRTG
ncbi:hypothetical protein CGK76_03330 [Erysipelotrichaceae bacterium 7770_A6]|nr:hypothetical protein [Erysipelotrichaceae bacterium 7770_A6]